ncbi:MAG: NYN domain-containing protein [Anaerolineae bacterium]|nr:NYN domain-containing protein [Anaerolineae bacterium]
MPVLIDGHNLIGRLPDIRLDDPDDEAKLVLRLRAYASRTRKPVTVVFDQGLPGGEALPLSGAGVKVIFAAAGRSADRLLVERVRRERDPRGLLVVTSDALVAAEAQARGARTMRSEEFAAQLAAPASVEDVPDTPLTPTEVEEWLKLFGAPTAGRKYTGPERW